MVFVSEELSSVETKTKERKMGNIIREFQKNLVVWKHGDKNMAIEIIEPVSEELSSVETIFSKYSAWQRGYGFRRT